ncbi:MAG TPA: hypothetical protein VGX26_08310 [Solirubrobacteraceae bacterium]|nr:hypothetical protein [Solirubrobacteraceae bacterium]
MRRRWGRVAPARPAAVVLAAAVCLLAAPSLARANSYHDFLCRIPYGAHAGRAAPADDVTYATTSGAPWLYAGDGCASGGGLYAAMDGGVSHPYGVSALNTFIAPAGLTIASFTLWRYEADTPVAAYGAPASNLLYSPGPPSVEGLCAQSLGCSSRGTPSNPFDPSNAVSVGQLGGVTLIQWSAACGGGPGGECPASGSGTLSSQYNVYAADIDLVDNTPPAVNGVSGPLVAGGTLAGQQAISFNASDGQSGVYSGSLIVDGETRVSQILDTNGGACQSLSVTKDGQRSFEHAQPCKPSVSASLTLDTSPLAAGQHALELIVNDAAGNQTIGYNGTITVSGPPLPGGPGGGPNGPCTATASSNQATLSARWTSTAKALRMSHYGAVDRITGRLMAPGGAGVAGATVAVCDTPAYHGAGTQQIGSVSTGTAGQWTLTLPRGVSSSALRFVYSNPQNPASAAAIATLRLAVHAGITLKIAPRSVSVGRKIFFSGVLHGTPIPEGGKQLVLEARSGGEWIQFDTIRTDAKGRYHASYRFRFPGPVTYRFRVLSRYEADFPFLDGTSRNVAVHER